MLAKKIERAFKITVKTLSIGYLIGLMSFLGTNLRASDRLDNYYGDPGSRAPFVPSYSRASLDRIKAFDTLVNTGLKQEISDLRVQLASLRQSMDDSYAHVSLDRLKALDTLVNSGVRQEIKNLQIELAGLRRAVDTVRWNPNREGHEYANSSATHFRSEQERRPTIERRLAERTSRIATNNDGLDEELAEIED